MEITLQAPAWACDAATPTGPCVLHAHSEEVPHVSETDRQANRQAMRDRHTTDLDGHRQAAQLRAEVDWIHKPELGPDPVQVAAVFRWPTAPKVSIAYWGTDGEPRMFTADNTRPVKLATDIDVAAILHRRSRHAYVRALGEVVASLEKNDFPLPQDGDPIDVSVRMPSWDALEQATKMLGLQVVEGPKSASAAWKIGSAVEVLLFWPYPKEPPPPADWSRSTVSGRDIDIDLEDTAVINGEEILGHAMGRNRWDGAA